MLELALFGAGSMGANHARLAMGLRDATLTLVVDPDERRGVEVASATGAEYCPRVEDALGRFDGAIVASPTPTHHGLAISLLEAGHHVLVEKPIASTVIEAAEMISAAEHADRILMVGHVERFNPAVLGLEGIVTEPIHVATQRISPFTPRIADGVTLDLMIHDLDLISSIANSPVQAVASITQDVLAHDDLTVATLRFQNGMTASATASRLGQDKIREVAITQPDSYVRLDLIRQSLTIHRVGSIGAMQEGGGYAQSGIVEVPFLRHRGEPLLLQLGHFVDCILKSEIPRVTGTDGLRAIEMVERVKAAAIAPSSQSSGVHS